jgi:hypothetical protein
MKAKAAFYFLILCRQLLSLESYRREKGIEVKAHCRILMAFYSISVFFHFKKTFSDSYL